jgi:hypothetical protein
MKHNPAHILMEILIRGLISAMSLMGNHRPKLNVRPRTVTRRAFPSKSRMSDSQCTEQPASRSGGQDVC